MTETVQVVIRNNLIDFDDQNPFRWWIEYDGWSYTVSVRQEPYGHVLAEIYHNGHHFSDRRPCVPDGTGTRDAITEVARKLVAYLRTGQVEVNGG